MEDVAFQLELTRPWMLAALVVLPLLVLYHFRSLIDFARWQRWFSFVCRTLVVLLLVLALAGLALLTPTTRQYVVFAVDSSLSIGEESRDAIQKYIDDAKLNFRRYSSS